MLHLDSITKRYSSGVLGVENLTLGLESGVVGLLGPNGAGKSTLIQMIATVTKPTSGTITFDGADIVKKPDAMRSRLGFLPQDFDVYDNLTAEEFLSYVAALKGIRSRARVMELLEMVNLHTVAKRIAAGFSGGMKQRLGIAQALINNPDVLIVDEPTAGLDPEERIRLRNILSEIGGGKLVILSTHIVSDIEAIATHIAIMAQSRLQAYSTPEALLKTAKGSCWQGVVSSEAFDRLRVMVRVSNAVRKADGVHVSVVAPAQPFDGAVAAEPTLEDAFLLTLQRAGVSQALPQNASQGTSQAGGRSWK
ncbi:MAG: ABC transporter ATP-binding protein [Candidatus Kapaibacterium sp.]|nr:MAG: ABC transporter ATP-binding protein [Candidatus Kapabacteria bacterium]